MSILDVIERGLSNVGSFISSTIDSATSTVASAVQAIQTQALTLIGDIESQYNGYAVPPSVSAIVQNIIDAKNAAQNAVLNFIGGIGGAGGAGGLYDAALNAANNFINSLTGGTGGSLVNNGGTESNPPAGQQTGIVTDIESFINGIISALENEFQSILDTIKKDIPTLSDIEAFFTTTIPTWAKGGYEYVDSNLFTRAIKWFGGLKDAFTYYVLGAGEVPPSGAWNVGQNQVTFYTTKAEADQFIQQVNETITAPRGILQVLEGVFLRVTLAVTALGSALEPVISQVRQQAASANPVEPLPVSTLVDAQYKGLVDAGEATATAGRQGVSPADYNILYRAGSYTPSPEEAAAWLTRGFITLEEYNVILAQNHAQGVVADHVRAAAIRPIPPQSPLQAAGRVSAFRAGFVGGSVSQPPPQEVIDLYNKNQLDEGQAIFDWASHWNIPPPDWFALASFRGLRPASDIPLSAIANNVPPEIAAIYADLARPVIPVRVTTTLLSKGILTDAQAHANYARLGYSEADIATLTAYAKSLIKKTDSAAPSTLSHLALSVGVGLYMDDVFTDEQLKELYQAHGYAPDAAGYAVEFEALKKAQAERKNAALDIVDSVDEGVYGQDQGVSNLHALGYTNREVLRYSKMMTKARIARAKLPTSAEIKAMYKMQLITEDDVSAYYMAEGYSDTWVPLLTKLITTAAPPKVGG